MNSPLVAVVTPVYNGAKYLSEALDSVQAQSYPNLVHIVLDNASTDATPEILGRYSQARVPVVVRRNSSLLPIAANWNAAVQLVPDEAKYFRILAADDFIAPDFIARTAALAERHDNVVVVGCRLHHRGLDEARTDWMAGREVFEGREAIRYFLSGAAMIIAHQTLIRSEVLKRRRPFFDESVIACDTDTCLALLRSGDWGFVHETLATTREHADTYTAKVKPLGLQLCEHLALISRHAEFAFGAREANSLFRLYRRYYVRQLLRGFDGERWRRHMDVLAGLGIRLTSADVVDAIVDWPIAKLRLRPLWSWDVRELAGGMHLERA